MRCWKIDSTADHVTDGTDVGDKVRLRVQHRPHSDLHSGGGKTPPEEEE